MLSHLSRYLQRECPITNVDFNTLDEQGVVVLGGKVYRDVQPHMTLGHGGIVITYFLGHA